MHTTIEGGARQAHLSDAQLIALLDGEDGWEAEGLRAHSDACRHCRDALAALEAKASVVGNWLARAESSAEPAHAPGLAPRWRFGLLQAAAILALMAVPALAHPGVRAWLRAGQADVPAPGVTDADPDAARSAAAGVTVLRFAPTGDALVVRFETTAADVDLEIVRGESAEAVLRVADPDAEAFVSELGLEVRPGRAGARYRLEIPRSVAVVTVSTPAGRRDLRSADLETGGSLLVPVDPR